jgi:hypothetical protein
MLKKLKKESGQAMVEFALVLPFLVVILCAIIDLGWLMYNRNQLTNIAGATARYAAIDIAEDGFGTYTFGNAESNRNGETVYAISDSNAGGRKDAKDRWQNYAKSNTLTSGLSNIRIDSYTDKSGKEFSTWYFPENDAQSQPEMVQVCLSADVKVLTGMTGVFRGGDNDFKMFAVASMPIYAFSEGE